MEAMGSDDPETERSDVLMRAIVRRAVADVQKVMAVEAHLLGDVCGPRSLLVAVPAGNDLFVTSAPIDWETVGIVGEMGMLGAIGHVSAVIEAQAARLAVARADLAWIRVVSELSKVRELLARLEAGGPRL